MRVSAFSVSNGFLTNLSDYSIAYLFLFVKKRKEGAAFLPDLRGRGILPPFDEKLSSDIFNFDGSHCGIEGWDSLWYRNGLAMVASGHYLYDWQYVASSDNFLFCKESIGMGS